MVWLLCRWNQRGLGRQPFRVLIPNAEPGDLIPGVALRGSACELLVDSLLLPHQSIEVGTEVDSDVLRQVAPIEEATAASDRLLDCHPLNL